MKSILVVDDDAFDSTLIANSLKSACATAAITVVNDSRKAADRFRDIKPDLTLLDISMPGFDGFEVLQVLNTCPERQDCAVVMLSGSTNPLDKSRAAELGANDYRVKPSRLDAYRELAEDLVAPGIVNSPSRRVGVPVTSFRGAMTACRNALRRTLKPRPAPHSPTVVL